MRRLKLGVTLVSVAVSIGVYATHTAGRLFPGLPLTVLFALISLGACVLWRRHSEVPVGPYLALIVVLSVTVKVYIFLFPTSLVGIDPNNYAVQIANLMETGSTYSIDFYFYSRAPFFLTLPAMFGLVAGLPATDALVIYPLALGLIVPLGVAVLTARGASRDGNTKMIVAAMVASAVTLSTRFSYWPIAQSLALAYWLIFLPLVIRSEGGVSNRTLVMLGTVLLALTFTHKLPLLVVSTVFASLILVRSVWGRVTRSSELLSVNRSFVIIGVITVIFLLAQWVFVTSFFQTVVVKSIAVLLTDTVDVSPPQILVPPTAAVSPPGGIVGILSRRMHGVSLLFFAGISGMYLLYARKNRPGILILACLPAPALLLALSITAGEISPIRAFIFMEPLLITVVALALVRRVHSRWGSAAVVAVLVLLLAPQLISAAAVPDSPNTPRYYLTESEVSGAEFGQDHVDNVVHTDWYVTLIRLPGLGLDDDSTKYTPIGTPLLNANVTEEGYENVLLRTDVSYYPTANGPWKLLYSPEETLDRGYNRIYESGETVLYDRRTTDRER